MNATSYDIKLRYSVDGSQARAGTRGVISDAKELQASTDRVTSSMMRMGGAIIAAFGARAAGKALIGFNANVEDTRQGIAGMLALSKHTNLSDELGRADKLMANLQRRANKLPGTTEEYATMAGMLAQPITSAGLGMKDLEDMTVQTVVAAKALRVEAGAAARDVDQALRGQFHSTDVFTGKLLGSIGYEGEEGRAKYNALSASKRAAELKRAEGQKQIEQLSEAQGATFSGAFSTLQDTIQQTLGKIGLPLFKAVTAELKQWNAYADKNGAVFTQWAHSIGNSLVDAFHVVKDVVGFIVDHADILMMIAKTWAVVKIGSSIGGAAQGAFGSGMGLLARASAFAMGTKGSDNAAREGGFGFEGGYKYQAGTAATGRQSWKAGGIGSALGMAGQALGAGLAIGTVLNEWTGASHGMAKLLEDIHPRMDATSAKFYQLEASMDAMDAAVAKSTDALTAGPGGLGDNFGGAPAARMQGMIDTYKNSVNLFDDAKRLFEAGDRWEGMKKLDQFTAAGGDPKAVEHDRAEIERLTTLKEQQRQQGEQLWLKGIQDLNATELKNLDQATVQTQILEFIQQGGLATLMKNDPAYGAFGGFLDDETIVRGFMKGDAAGASNAEKPKVNITIQRIEVQSDDPDRFAFGMVEAFRDAAKNPSSALSVLREG